MPLKFINNSIASGIPRITISLLKTNSPSINLSTTIVAFEDAIPVLASIFVRFKIAFGMPISLVN
jgi:hypothetical protein